MTSEKGDDGVGGDVPATGRRLMAPVTEGGGNPSRATLSPAEVDGGGMGGRNPETPGVTPLLQVPSFDWRVWEDHPETTRTALSAIEASRPHGAREYGLVEVRLGHGKVYLCQLPVDLYEGRAAELARQLLTNLGVRLERRPEAKKTAPSVDADGFIRSWLVCGPFTAEASGSLLDVDFLGGESAVRPEPGGKAQGGRDWRVYDSPEAAVDFESPDLFGAMDKAAAYAGVYVEVPGGRSGVAPGPENRVDLLFGSDDGCAVWLNGERLYFDASSRPLVVDNIRIEGVPLRRGWNFLLFKVEDRVWRWGLVARLVGSDGSPVSALTISPGKVPAEESREEFVAPGDRSRE